MWPSGEKICRAHQVSVVFQILFIYLSVDDAGGPSAYELRALQ